jgi:hypothetical protein
VYAAHDPTSPFLLFYLWVAFYAFYFLNRAQAAIQTIFIGVAYGAVLATDAASLKLAFVRWMVFTIALVVAGLLVRVWTKGGLVTGSDGFLVTDQMQYLNWLRQAGEHVTIENLYDLRPGPASFLHPGVLVSGLLHRIGLGLTASYMAWKPVAVGALFAAALLYVRRFLDREGDRRLALVVALFAVSPSAVIVGWAGIGGDLRKFQFDFLANEMWPGNYLWGYLFTAISVAMLPLALLAYERGRLPWAAVAALVASWFMLAERMEGVSAVRTVPLHREELRQTALAALESWRGQPAQGGKRAIGVAWLREWLEQLGTLVQDLEAPAASAADNAAAPWWR